MEKNNFMLIISILLVVSYSQLSGKGSKLNSLRKLDININETILLGFDNYYRIPSDQLNHSSTFYTYFLLKNWNTSSYDNFDDFKNNSNFDLIGNITYTNKTLGTDKINIHCKSDENNYNIYDDKEYHIIRYICESEPIWKDLPKKINLITNLTDIQLNETKVTKVSSTAYALAKDIVSMKNSKLIGKNKKDIEILENATFISQNPNSFKIMGKGGINSEKIELITISNGYTKKIPCKGEYPKYNPDYDNEERYYYLESIGSQDLQNIDLEYAIANFTKQDKILILDFKDGVNGTIKPKEFVKKNSGGLSTGGIVAVAVPTLIVLLGVGGLAFFLSRKPLPPPPMKNIANNSIGVVSSEAIVHQ